MPCRRASTNCVAPGKSRGREARVNADEGVGDPGDVTWARMDTPRQPMVVTILLLLAEPLDEERLREVLNRRLLAFARFRQRLVQRRRPPRLDRGCGVRSEPPPRMAAPAGAGRSAGAGNAGRRNGQPAAGCGPAAVALRGGGECWIGLCGAVPGPSLHCRWHRVAAGVSDPDRPDAASGRSGPWRGRRRWRNSAIRPAWRRRPPKRQAALQWAGAAAVGWGAPGGVAAATPGAPGNPHRVCGGR